MKERVKELFVILSGWKQIMSCDEGVVYKEFETPDLFIKNHIFFSDECIKLNSLSSFMVLAYFPLSFRGNECSLVILFYSVFSAIHLYHKGHHWILNSLFWFSKMTLFLVTWWLACFFTLRDTFHSGWHIYNWFVFHLNRLCNCTTGKVPSRL